MKDSDFLTITPLGPPIEIKPPVDLVIESAGGGKWIHHVDAEGKAAGGNWNGIKYEGSVNNLYSDPAFLELIQKTPNSKPPSDVPPVAD